MRFTSYLLILFLLSSLSYMSSCSREINGVSPYVGLKVSSQLVDNLGGKLVTGKVSTYEPGNGEVVIMITSEENQYKEVVMLQRQSSSNLKAIGLNNLKAEIIKSPGFILVNSLETDDRFVFMVDSEQTNSLLDKLPESYKPLSLYGGYGLSVRTGGLTNSPSPKIYYNKLNQALARGRVDCQSGGAGSSSCSSSTDGGSSCSVSCGANYFACCNGGISCNCQPNS